MNLSSLPERPSYFHYWGKARPSVLGGPSFHPLPYHCLDVAAVASGWWNVSPAIRRAFQEAFKGTEADVLRAWVLFFVTLHDLGKFDMRFQAKAPFARLLCWPEFDPASADLTKNAVERFDHGSAGYAWFVIEVAETISRPVYEDNALECWTNWMSAVTGHHGELLNSVQGFGPPEADEPLLAHDRAARREWFCAMESLFLAPVGLSLTDVPPECGPAAKMLVAGFCAVCDWVGSGETFRYATFGPDLEAYFKERQALVQGSQLLVQLGLLLSAAPYEGISAVLPHSVKSPRGVQTIVDDLPTTSGLLLIEAPTGSGKTEAALAYAWKVLATGEADSIVFALPTQATANAMFERLIRFAQRIFPDGGPSVVLAHGKRGFNGDFRTLIEAGATRTAQGRIEASVQCAEWLAQSRKRVFLGQIGVCTIDQVLLSVLPIRHRFVRGFGLNKSVLIVDEVHAYDAYMNGLLEQVLTRQRVVGGFAILLSATLPSSVRGRLLKAWGAALPEVGAYPLLTHATAERLVPRVPDDPAVPRDVGVELVSLRNGEPDDALLNELIEAARSGARVAVVCNLVDVAQGVARRLRACSDIPVDLFHARYCFGDRQMKEDGVLAEYGKEALRGVGRILVATQVVEQSLDLDFDWLITQICPADLLFQRIGRLHRHPRPRPIGFESPRVRVLTVEGDDYGLHKLIYGNTRVLWRTQQLLQQAQQARGCIAFPGAYREWIEAVYDGDDWGDEPAQVVLDYDRFWVMQNESRKEALRRVNMTIKAFRDDEGIVSALTRDGEMSLNVLPQLANGRLLDGTRIASLDERQRGETLNLATVAVPAGWERLMKDCSFDEEGRILLSLAPSGEMEWSGLVGKNAFLYSTEYGMEKDKR